MGNANEVLRALEKGPFLGGDRAIFSGVNDLKVMANLLEPVVGDLIDQSMDFGA